MIADWSVFPRWPLVHTLLGRLRRTCQVNISICSAPPNRVRTFSNKSCWKNHKANVPLFQDHADIPCGNIMTLKKKVLCIRPFFLWRHYSNNSARRRVSLDLGSSSLSLIHVAIDPRSRTGQYTTSVSPKILIGVYSLGHIQDITFSRKKCPTSGSF